MRIIPAIDIIDGKCVRLSQGDYAQKKVYHEQPLDVARTYADAGLQYLHLVDLDGAKAGRVTNWKVVEDITRNTNLQVDFGGGVKTEDELKRLFDLGVRQVNLGSIAVKKPDHVLMWLHTFGADQIILSADVKGEQVAISGWLEESNLDVYTFIQSYYHYGLRHVVCTDIHTDGMLSGPNISLYTSILQRFPDLKLIASGGVSGYDDLTALKTSGVSGVIIGKAIYEGRVEINRLAKL